MRDSWVLKLWKVKFWPIKIGFSNLPIFSTVNISHYTYIHVLCCVCMCVHTRAQLCVCIIQVSTHSPTVVLCAETDCFFFSLAFSSFTSVIITSGQVLSLLRTTTNHTNNNNAKYHHCHTSRKWQEILILVLRARIEGIRRYTKYIL